MRQRLILIAIALVFPALAHADIARKCKDATYVFSQAAGCVKRTSAKPSPRRTHELALDALETDPKKAFAMFEKACQEISDRPVLAGCIGPFSLAGRLMDVSEIMILCYEEPELVHAVLGKAGVPERTSLM